MTNQDLRKHTIGWVGAGRMGYHMAERLIKAGCDVSVMDIVFEKIQPLKDMGAQLAKAPADVGDRDIVFFSVPGPKEFKEAVLGANGVLSRGDKGPKILVDCSSVSAEASSEVREAAAKKGTDLVVASVSGNHHVIIAGKLTVVSSGPKAAFDAVEPYLDVIGPGGVSYVGEGELARMVKICHNVLLGVYTQNLAEIVVLAEKFGVPRHAFMDFINKSVMGSVFSRYKTPAIVNLDYSTTFTAHLLKKDMDLGLAAGRSLDVPMPVTAAAREMVQTMIGYGYTEVDFMALLSLTARASGIELKPENVEVTTSL